MAASTTPSDPRAPGWRRAQLREAAERERARRERDPEAFLAAAREKTARCRARQRARALTFHELLRSTGVEPDVLRLVLRDEVRRGRVVYHGASRRFELNGKLPRRPAPGVPRSRPRERPAPTSR